MTTIDDIIIVGSGLTGLSMAAALSHFGINATIIAPKKEKSKNSDRRSTTIMSDGIRFLTDINVWGKCQKHATPLEIMRIINGGQIIDFDAQEMNRDAFAFNILNADLLASLTKIIKKSKSITWIDDIVTSVDHDAYGITTTTKKNGLIKGQLVIAADGRQSKIRQSFNIKNRHQDFKQKAFVCTFKHTHKHDNTSIEIHRAGGPFTTVPLAGDESALVWCDHAHVMDDVMVLPSKQQSDLIQKIIEPHLGNIEITSSPQIWPIHALKSQQLIAPYTAFIGEAAHTLPPIAAQGFNLSLRDVMALTDVIKNAQRLGLNLGASHVLKPYQDQRWRDIALRYHSVGMLNTLIANNSLPAKLLRKVGLSAVEWVTPLRHNVMQFGMKG